MPHDIMQGEVKEINLDEESSPSKTLEHAGTVLTDLAVWTSLILFNSCSFYINKLVAEQRAAEQMTCRMHRRATLPEG